jgi:NTE family protein
VPKYVHDELLERHLRACLGDLDAAALDFLRSRLEWVEIGAGDSLFISISGRLRVYITDDDGAEHLVREMTRGQIIGELSMYTEEPRSATVVAIRDSVLVKLARKEFAALLQESPAMSVLLTRQIIHRLQTAHTRRDIPRPVTIGILPITAGVDLGDFCAKLAEQLKAAGRVEMVDAGRIDRELQQGDVEHGDANKRISLFLDRIEAASDYVLLIGDDGPSSWTHRCSQHCDEMLLLADAAQPPVLHEIETRFLMNRHGRTEAAEILVLLHDAGKRCPSGTREWLARRPVSGHHHIRPALTRDLARLARFLSGRATGMVMAGGGARGCAHLGIYRALVERGIEVDCVGGTSIGSVMAVYVAADRPIGEVVEIARETLMAKPTGDYNIIPLISLVKGVRLRRIISSGIHKLLGHPADVEDLWKNYYCIASNYSLAAEHVIRHGDLSRALRASSAIPGALPPVVQDGSLLCDGGTFNNFPVDVMRNMRGVGKVIGVDLGLQRRRPIDIGEVPGSWTLLRDRLRRRAKRRFRLPSLIGYLMNVTILYSSSRQRENRKLTDLYFNPPLERVGMLDWHKFDSIVDQAYRHAVGELDAVAADQPD